jgi:hypothetical protein
MRDPEPCSTLLRFAVIGVVATFALAACGGSTVDAAPRDGQASDASVASDSDSGGAQDGAGEQRFWACFDASVASVKACRSDSDCLSQSQQADCCGGVFIMGINRMFLDPFQVCEDLWLRQFPSCLMPDCGAVSTTRTEDGKINAYGSNGSIEVHCVNSMNGSCGVSGTSPCECMSSTH